MSAPEPHQAADVLAHLDRAAACLLAAADAEHDRRVLDRAAVTLAGARAELEPLVRS